MMKPLGFIKEWKGLIILVATAHLIFVGESNYMEAVLFYYNLSSCPSLEFCLSVTCELNIAKDQQQIISNGTIYIYRQNKTFDLWQRKHRQKFIIEPTCEEYNMTYRCVYSYEVDNCGNTREVNTSVDVKFPENGCGKVLNEPIKINVSLETNNDNCPTHNDGTTPMNDGNTPKNDCNSQVLTTIAIALPPYILVAVVATVAGYWYCQNKKATKSNEEIVPTKEDKQEENVSEAVEPATMDVSSDQTMDDDASLNVDDAASGMSKATDASSERSDDKRSSWSSGSSDASSVKTVGASPV